MKILLVEDNQTNCFLLSDYLEYCGYYVHAITSSELFFSTLEWFQPNLILLDLKMPKIDGYTLLEEMQSCPLWKHIPVIVISALSFRTHQTKAFQLGACRYLVKPIVPDILKNVIQEELANATVASEDAEQAIIHSSVIPFSIVTQAQVC